MATSLTPLTVTCALGLSVRAPWTFKAVVVVDDTAPVLVTFSALATVVVPKVIVLLAPPVVDVGSSV